MKLDHTTLGRRSDLQSTWEVPQVSTLCSSDRSCEGGIARTEGIGQRRMGLPIKETVVLYCARHRFSTDAMEGAGNVMAVMDAMGHQSVNTMRIYATRTSGRFGKPLSAG